MATVANVSNSQTVGDVRTAALDVTFSSSYPTGGEALTAAQFGLQNVYFAIATVKTAGTGSVTAAYYDIANAKLKAFVAAAEVTNATNISAVTVQVVAFGK